MKIKDLIAEILNDTTYVLNPEDTNIHEDAHPLNPFDEVRGQIKFEGFTDEQKEIILNNREREYNNSPTARRMIDEALALPDGLTYYNSNSQIIMKDLAN